MIDLCISKIYIIIIEKDLKIETEKVQDYKDALASVDFHELIQHPLTEKNRPLDTDTLNIDTNKNSDSSNYSKPIETKK